MEKPNIFFTEQQSSDTDTRIAFENNTLDNEISGVDPPERLISTDRRDRFWHGPAGRLIMRIGAVAGLISASIAGTELPASADTVAVQRVYNTGGEGLWLHPGSADIHSGLSDLMADGTEFDISCHTTGSSVNGDNAWLYGVNSATGHTGYAADFYIDTNVHQGSENAELTRLGIPECGSNSNPQGNNSQPAATVPPFASFDRNAVANWALSHAEEAPPNDGSCTIFASRALWAGGMPQTPDWNYQPHVISGGWRDGSNDAWAAQNFVDYMRTQPFVQFEALGHMGPNNNNVPDAKLGDVIAYDWNDDGSIDHIDVVTGFSGQYPLVSGWSEDGAKALSYNQRGWTYSQEEGTWLQLEKDSNGNYPNMNMEAYLIHFRDDSDLNIN